MPENAFVGVDKIYQNFADVTTEPLFSEDEKEKALEVAQQDSAENAKVDLDEQTGLPVYAAPFGNDKTDDADGGSEGDDKGDGEPAPVDPPKAPAAKTAAKSTAAKTESK